MAKKKQIKIEDPKTTRTKAGLSQSSFWTPLGVTQSGASRYESGRRIPKPVAMLIALSTGKATIEQLQSGELAANIQTAYFTQP